MVHMIFSGMKIEDEAGRKEAALRIAELGSPAVLIKGGHGTVPARNIFVGLHGSIKGIDPPLVLVADPAHGSIFMIGQFL